MFLIVWKYNRYVALVKVWKLKANANYLPSVNIDTFLINIRSFQSYHSVYFYSESVNYFNYDVFII